MIQRFAVVAPTKKATPANVEVQNTLTKYFTLNPNVGRYEQIVNRIVAVYRAMQTGLVGGYSLYAYAQPRTEKSFEHAFVKVNHNANKALSHFFADVGERHWQWDKFKEEARKYAGEPDSALAEDIHLNYEWFKDSNVDMDMVALTIVHEASHKWAHTTDVCYKSSTFSKTASSDSLADGVRQGFQPTIERQNEPKGPILNCKRDRRSRSDHPRSLSQPHSPPNAHRVRWALTDTSCSAVRVRHACWGCHRAARIVENTHQGAAEASVAHHPPFRRRRHCRPIRAGHWSKKYRCPRRAESRPG
jgi:hypothetical protein